MLVPGKVVRQWGDLGILAGGNFVQLGLRVLLGPLVPLLLFEFETTKAALGAVLTGMWGIYAIHQFPSGVLADKYGERALLIAGLLGSITGGILAGIAPSLPIFAVFALVIGAGAGLYFAPASSLITRLYTDHGAPLGVFTAAGSIAGVLYPALGSFIAIRFGWRTAVLVGGITGVPVAFAIFRFVPTPAPTNPERQLKSAFSINRIWGLLSRPGVAFTVGIGTLVGFSFQGLVTFFPTFLVEYYRIEPGIAGAIFAVLFALSSIAQPIAGNVSDRYTRDVALAMSVTIAATGLVILLADFGLVGLAAGTALLGVGVSWPGVLQARFMDQFTSAERGYGFGLVRSVYMLMAATGSVVVGTFADNSGWLLGYGVIVILFVLCLGALGINHALGLDL